MNIHAGKQIPDFNLDEFKDHAHPEPDLTISFVFIFAGLFGFITICLMIMCKRKKRRYSRIRYSSEDSETSEEPTRRFVIDDSS